MKNNKEKEMTQAEALAAFDAYCKARKIGKYAPNKR